MTIIQLKVAIQGEKTEECNPLSRVKSVSGNQPRDDPGAKIISKGH